MNYALAKELKDAGYPVGESDVPGIGHVSNLGAYHPTKAYWTGFSLSKLIEACGDNLLGIEHVLDGGLDGREKLWWASSRNHGMAGESPEEAVARLWLALNREKP